MIDVSRKTYFSPYDNAEQALLDAVCDAKFKIRLADYSYNLKNLTDLLIEKHRNGVDVSLVLDKSQAGGKSEVPEINALKAAGVPLAIGTSSEHKIMHSKYAVIDDLIVASGSYNFTGTAEHEDNFLDVESNLDRAKAFTEVWQKMHDWIAQNQSNGIINQ